MPLAASYSSLRLTSGCACHATGHCFCRADAQQGLGDVKPGTFQLDKFCMEPSSIKVGFCNCTLDVHRRGGALAQFERPTSAGHPWGSLPLHGALSIQISGSSAAPMLGCTSARHGWTVRMLISQDSFLAPATLQPCRNRLTRLLLPLLPFNSCASVIAGEDARFQGV